MSTYVYRGIEAQRPASVINSSHIGNQFFPIGPNKLMVAPRPAISVISHEFSAALSSSTFRTFTRPDVWKKSFGGRANRQRRVRRSTRKSPAVWHAPASTLCQHCWKRNNSLQSTEAWYHLNQGSRPVPHTHFEKHGGHMAKVYHHWCQQNEPAQWIWSRHELQSRLYRNQAPQSWCDLEAMCLYTWSTVRRCHQSSTSTHQKLFLTSWRSSPSGQREPTNTKVSSRNTITHGSTLY